MNLLAWASLFVLTWASWRALVRGAKKRRDARNRRRYQDGFNYVRDSLLATGPTHNAIAKLWQEYEAGMAVDPTHFEIGMRDALHLLASPEP